MKEVTGVGSGWIGLYTKGVLPGELFAVSRNQLTLGGAVLQGQQRPKVTASETHGDARSQF